MGRPLRLQLEERQESHSIVRNPLVDPNHCQDGGVPAPPLAPEPGCINIGGAGKELPTCIRPNRTVLEGCSSSKEEDAARKRRQGTLRQTYWPGAAVGGGQGEGMVWGFRASMPSPLPGDIGYRPWHAHINQKWCKCTTLHACITSG